ncbi:MAG: alpha/beta hydrolase family protein [Verrucomicrobiia bacterium]
MGALEISSNASTTGVAEKNAGQTSGEAKHVVRTPVVREQSHQDLGWYPDRSGLPRPVKSVSDWKRRRQAVLGAMERVTGAVPGREKRCRVQCEVIEEVDCGDYVRRDIRYTAEPGDWVPAYLLIPKNALDGRARCHGVLCLHQTHPAGRRVVVGLGQSPDDEYGIELVKRGYVCLAPAYPLLADYHPPLRELGYQSGVMKAVWNNMRGLDMLESMPFVVRSRFGAIGHSLGGHTGLFTAAFDSRIKVVVTSCGFDSFIDYMGGDIQGWTSSRYMPRLAEYPRGQVPFDFHEVLGMLAPRWCLVSAPIEDTNFRWESVARIGRQVTRVYGLYGCPERFGVLHPNCGHRFPPEIRETAYQWLDKALR